MTFGDQWQPCTGSTAARTSGVAYFFSSKLRESEPSIPVGIIVTSRSGTPIEYWTPVDSLKTIAFCQSTTERFDPAAEEGKAWREFMALEESWKTNFRKSGRDRKAVRKKPTYVAGYETEVLARIYADKAPGRLWLERIQPWAGFPISGAVWYQGERNTKAGEACASSYGNMLSTMIQSWRSAWGQGDFQFLVVQLPSYLDGGPNWKIVQEQQASAVTKINNAEYVDIRDLPDAGLHPSNKRPVGERLAAKVKN